MFELVRTLTLEADRATGIAEIAADHPTLVDHFPGHPVLPGTWLVELAAQIAGPLAEAAHPGRWAILAMIRDAKLLAPVALPAVVAIEAVLDPAPDATHARARATARTGDTLVLRAELVFAMIDAPPGAETAIAARAERLARWTGGAR